MELRTTDTAAARSFYRRVLGHDRAVIWPLHEQARARGARPHWLGLLDVADVERTAAAFVERGATRLGPTQPTSDGGQSAVLRDAGGAIMALTTAPPANATETLEAAWHLLNTNDAARAIVNYHELFGWEFQPRFDVPGHGALHPFAWQVGGPSVGSVMDIAQMPGRHPHWLFFFRVDALEPAIQAARAAGGVALDPLVLPSGERVCVCDDPEGAAFGLLA